MQPVVIDANLAVALLVRLPYSSLAEDRFRFWKQQETPLVAPALWPAEVTSSLRKAVVIGQITEQDAFSSIKYLQKIGIQVITPDEDLLTRSLKWAGRIGQTVAYDAQYLALAERLEAEFWTADERLFNTLRVLGIGWVHRVEKERRNP